MLVIRIFYGYYHLIIIVIDVLAPVIIRFLLSLSLVRQVVVWWYQRRGTRLPWIRLHSTGFGLVAFARLFLRTG